MNTELIVAAINHAIDLNSNAGKSGENKVKPEWYFYLHHSPETYRGQLKRAGHFLYFLADSLQDAVDAIKLLSETDSRDSRLIENISDLSLDNRQGIYVIAYTEI